MRLLRQFAAAVRLNHARGAHTTDAAAIVAVGAGFFAVLGFRQFACALLPGAAIFWLVPALLEPGSPGSRSSRPTPRGPTSPTGFLVRRVVATHGGHALGIGWFLGWSISVAGAGPVVAVLALAAGVYEVPRLLLPVVFGRRVAPGTRPLKHVLLQRSDVIGDVVMATPCIESIKQADPECRVSVLCRESTSELLRGHPCVETVIVDPTATGQRQAEGWRTSAVGRLVTRLRQRQIDALVSLWDRPSSLYPLAAALAGIPVRAGNWTGWGGWLLNAGAAPAATETLHEVEENLRRTRTLGFDAGAAPRLSIALSAANVERARALLADRHVAEDAFLVGLSPATSGTNRRLEPGTYARFADRIHRSHGATTLLLGAPGDRELTGSIMRAAPPGTIDLAGETSVGVLAAVIARCRIHVGGDSGPAHIAAALGIPGVVISPARSQKPLRWGPWLAPHRVVRKRPGCRLPCFPGQCRDDSCVAAITVDDVWEAFDRVAAGDGIVEPSHGRRYWGSLSVPVLLHAPAGSRHADVMAALRLLRSAGFIEFVVMCERGSAVDTQARAEGFESRGAARLSLVNAILEFGGGVVYDLAARETSALRMALWVARRAGCGVRRVAAREVPGEPGALADVIIGA